MTGYSVILENRNRQKRTLIVEEIDPLYCYAGIAEVANIYSAKLQTIQSSPNMAILPATDQQRKPFLPPTGTECAVEFFSHCCSRTHRFREKWVRREIGRQFGSRKTM